MTSSLTATLTPQSGPMPTLFQSIRAWVSITRDGKPVVGPIPYASVESANVAAEKLLARWNRFGNSLPKA